LGVLRAWARGASTDAVNALLARGRSAMEIAALVAYFSVQKGLASLIRHDFS